MAAKNTRLASKTRKVMKATYVTPSGESFDNKGDAFKSIARNELETLLRENFYSSDSEQIARVIVEHADEVLDILEELSGR